MKRWINNFATRSFRDMADLDYIHARLAYRSRLIPQFLWSSLQSIEKYFKAILLYNRIEALDVYHSLEKALEYAEVLPFKLRLSPSALGFVTYIDRYGAYRYLESSYQIQGPKLVELDRTVWEVRRYCHVVDYSKLIDGEKKSALTGELEKIAHAEKEPPHKFRAFEGVLETVIDQRGHPSRPALIWQNGYFGARSRRTVKFHPHKNFTNAPLTLKPEMLDELEKFVYIPGPVKKAYRRELQRRAGEGLGA